MRSNLAIVVAGGREAGTGWWDDRVGVGRGREIGVPQIEQDDGLFSLGLTGSSVSINNAAQTFARRNMRVAALTYPLRWIAGFRSMILSKTRRRER